MHVLNGMWFLCIPKEIKKLLEHCGILFWYGPWNNWIILNIIEDSQPMDGQLKENFTKHVIAMIKQNQINPILIGIGIIQNNMDGERT